MKSEILVKTADDCNHTVGLNANTNATSRRGINVYTVHCAALEEQSSFLKRNNITVLFGFR